MALCLGSGVALASAATPAAASTVIYDFVSTCSSCAGMGVGEIVLQDYTPGQKLTMANFASFTFTTSFGQILVNSSQLTAFNALLDPTNLDSAHFMIGEGGQTFESTGTGIWEVVSSLNGATSGGGGGGGGGSRQGQDQTSGDPPPQFGSFDSGADFESMSFIQSDAGVLPGVPEPTTWALMIGGFAGVGGLLRDRKRRAARLEVA